MTGKRIAVMGGGHGARTVAADMALAGHEVRLFEFPQFHADVSAIFDSRVIEITGRARTGAGRLALATHEIAEAVAGVGLILVVVPALYHRAYAQALAPHLRDEHHVVLLPGTLGALEFARQIRDDGCTAEVTISELDTLPYATRRTAPTSVHVYHALPAFGLVCWSQLGDMLGVPTPLMKATVEIGIAISGVNHWESGRTVARCGIAGMSVSQLVEYAKTGHAAEGRD